MNPIQKLADIVGFHKSYKNCFGDEVQANEESCKVLLSAMGYDVSSETLIIEEIENHQNESWIKPLPYTLILPSESTKYFIQLSVPLISEKESVFWLIHLENGQKLSGSYQLSDLKIISAKNIHDAQYQKYTLPIPLLVEGYHQLQVKIKGKVNIDDECQLIVAPKTCYGPKDCADHKMWGLATQLYSLNSKRNWGLGDFTDLKELVSKAADKGAATIGLNPLHPLFPGNRAHRSPYSPTSRSFLNTIYVDIEDVPNFSECEVAKLLIESETFQMKINEAKKSELIDYVLIANLKYEVLELLFKHFNQYHIKQNSPLAEEFRRFKSEFNTELETLACFDALYEYFRTKNPENYGWPTWPDEYQNPDSEAVSQFKIAHQSRLEYFKYLQWIADKQLSEVTKLVNDKAMPIGLYLDLAVGCDGGGADVWANQSVYVAGGSVGAPPDATNLLGQNWGLTPINPIELKKQGFQPLVKALRSCMRHAGALRIDHVLGYMRQYWVAPGKNADQGIFITFPFEEMLRIIALESRRSKCIIIGEDLGTVPDGFGEIMASAGLLSYKLLSFERWESGLYKRPDQYPEQSMVTVSTHDLPTLKGWWEANDLLWRNKLNLYPDEAISNLDADNRVKERDLLLCALKDMEVIDVNKLPSTEPPVMNEELFKAVQRFLSKAPSMIQMTPMEDALGLTEQVNIPGTIDEHPNWLQKLPVEMNNIWINQSMESLIDIMNEERVK